MNFTHRPHHTWREPSLFGQKLGMDKPPERRTAAPFLRAAAVYDGSSQSPDEPDNQECAVNRLRNLERVVAESGGSYVAARDCGDIRTARKYLGKIDAAKQAIRDLRAAALVGRVGLEWGQA